MVGFLLNPMGTQGFLYLSPLQGDNAVMCRDLLGKCIPFLPSTHAIPATWHFLVSPLCLAEVNSSPRSQFKCLILRDSFPNPLAWSHTRIDALLICSQRTLYFSLDASTQSVTLVILRNSLPVSFCKLQQCRDLPFLVHYHIPASNITSDISKCSKKLME